MPGRDLDEVDDDLDLDDERASRPARSPPARRRGPSGGVRPWDATGEPSDEEEWSADRRAGGWWHRTRSPVYWRARDSLYFEPLVALSVVILLLVGLYTFTVNWPPAYVVESKSMEHGKYQVGYINAGDLILAEKVANSSIVPYVTAYREDVRTYGEFGDVILYHPNGSATTTPIVHRAILFLQWVPALNAYDAPDLRGLPCGSGTNLTHGELYYSAGGSGCATTDLDGAFKLYNVGYNAVEVALDLADYQAIGEHSGYITLGDNNSGTVDQTPIDPTTPHLSTLVEPGWIIGVARGMLPWFGDLKLLFDGNTKNVSPASWEFLGLTLIVAIFAGFGIHYALRFEGIESPTRRRLEEEEAEERGEPDEEPRTHRFFGAVRAWRDEPEADDEAAPARRARAETRHPRDRPDDPHGRPRPRVRRPSRRHRDDDER